MRPEIAILALIWLTACSQRRDLFAIEAPNDLNADEKRVIDAAAQFVSTNQNWPGGTFERPKNTTNGGWSILVSRNPRRGEDKMVVLVDGAGQVTKAHVTQ